jgi:hypothetical protein
MTPFPLPLIGADGGGARRSIHTMLVLFWQKNSTRSSDSPRRWPNSGGNELLLLVEKRWPWPQPKLGKPNTSINPSGPPALSESEAKAFVEGVETAQDALTNVLQCWLALAQHREARYPDNPFP